MSTDETNNTVINRARRRPKFTQPAPVQTDDAVLERMNFLGGENVAKKPDFGTRRSIAGDLPRWSPKPPGELLVERVVKRG